jgi:hypothetical protein
MRRTGRSAGDAAAPVQTGGKVLVAPHRKGTRSGTAKQSSRVSEIGRVP